MVPETQTLLVLNGPNLNMLGVREPATYGSATLGDVEDLCRLTAARFGLSVDCRQSNNEGDLVSWIQESRTRHAGIVLNAGAYTHTSIALFDAIKIAEKPLIEVHISNVFARETFRHASFISPVAMGVIAGLGLRGYALAVEALADILKMTPLS